LNKKNLDEIYSRDYNIINNKYKLFDTEKKQTDRQIQNLNALRKMQNMKTYDIIRGRYKNQILEQKLQEKEKLEKNKKPAGVRDKNYIVRNPLNNIIYDQEEQKRLDTIEYQKKQRFLSKEYVNDYYHSKHNNLESQKLISHQHYFNPFEYRMNNIRGYDILTNKSQTIMEGNKYLTDIQSKKLETQWDKIKNNADKKNNTFKSKNLYLAEYDSNDIDLHYSNYLSMRKPILEQRANTIDIIHRNNGKNGKNGNTLTKSIDISKNNNVFNRYENLINYKYKRNETIDKDKFFGTPKAMLSSI
jgi:predicted DNA-binding WGR domain protein